MLQGRTALLLGTMIVSLGVLLGGWGCSSRQVTSGSSDQSMTKGKGAAETVRQEPIAAIAEPPANTDVRELETRPNLVQPSAPGSGSVPSRGTTPPPSSASRVAPSSPAPDLSDLADIYFDFDQYAVRRDAQAVLESNARWLRNDQSRSLLIEGHCDERGTLAYNLVLGEKRARAAKRYLEELGIPASRLQTTSYGEVKPFCKEHNEGCWKYNRRAHFVLQ